MIKDNIHKEFRNGSVHRKEESHGGIRATDVNAESVIQELYVSHGRLLYNAGR